MSISEEYPRELLKALNTLLEKGIIFADAEFPFFENGYKGPAHKVRQELQQEFFEFMKHTQRPEEEDEDIEEDDITEDDEGNDPRDYLALTEQRIPCGNNSGEFCWAIYRAFKVGNIFAAYDEHFCNNKIDITKYMSK